VTATIVSLNIGRVETRPVPGPRRSAIWKRPVLVPLALGVDGLAGDHQANRRLHGGPDKAVCVYSAEHTAWWQVELDADEWGPGAVGENVTVAGQTERDVCLGDVYEVGTALVEVSQPRSPCQTLARRWARPDLPKRVVHSGRSGWYLRVRRTGIVERGLPLILRERPHPTWTILRVNRVSYGQDADAVAAAHELAAVPALAAAWRDGLRLARS
jgi:MOSC domain-containing protein YiiM